MWAQDSPSSGDIHVCVGKEWYRFPSRFFLPSEKVHLSFLRSGFRGLLPKEFSPHENATSIMPQGFNDMNREEMDRYVSLDQCDYIVDFDFEGQHEDRYTRLHDFQVIFKAPFLNADRSSRFLTRAFFLGENSMRRYNTYDDYVLLRRVKKV